MKVRAAWDAWYAMWMRIHSHWTSWIGYALIVAGFGYDLYPRIKAVLEGGGATTYVVVGVLVVIFRARHDLMGAWAQYKAEVAE